MYDRQIYGKHDAVTENHDDKNKEDNQQQFQNQQLWEEHENILVQMEPLKLSDSLEAMLISAEKKQQQSDTSDTDKTTELFGPVSLLSGIPINDRIRFERSFAGKQKNDSKKMAEVRQAVKEFFDLEETDREGKIAKLKEVIERCDNYLANRNSSRQRGLTRREDVLDVRAKACIRLSELDKTVNVIYPQKEEDQHAFAEKLREYSETEEDLDLLYENITARYDVLQLFADKKMDLAGYRDYASTVKNLLNRVNNFSVLLHRKAVSGGVYDQAQVDKLMEISDRCNEILRGGENAVISEQEQENITEVVNGSDKYLSGLMEDILEKEKSKFIELREKHFYFETETIYANRTGGSEYFYDNYLLRVHGDFIDTIKEKSTEARKTARLCKHKEMIKEALKERIKNEYPHNVAVALMAKLDQMVEDENKQITEKVRKDYQRDQEVYERTYLTAKPVKDWDEEDIKYLQMRDGEKWVSDINKRTKEFPLPAVHILDRKEDLPVEIKTLVFSRMKETETHTPIADGMLKKMQATKETWSKYGRAPLRFYGRLCNLEMAARQIMDEKNAAFELLLSSEGQAYKDKLQDHITVLEGEIQKAQAEIDVIRGTIGSFCEKEDHKLSSREEDILNKAMLDEALTDTLMQTGIEHDKSQAKWTVNTVAKAKTLISLPGIDREYPQFVRSVIFAMNEAEAGNIPDVDYREFMKMVEALEKVGKEAFEKEEIPEAIVDLQYYILNHSFSNYVRIDVVSSISEHQGKYLPKEESQAIGDYIKSSFMLNGYLRMGINVDTNKVMEDGEKKDELLKQRDDISKAIEKNKVKKDMKSYRGTDDKYMRFWLKTLGVEVETIPGTDLIDHKKMAARMDEIRRQIVGQVYVDKGFSSTTTEKNYAADWVKSNIKGNLSMDLMNMEGENAAEYQDMLLNKPAEELPGQHLMLIDVPAGCSAALIDKMGPSKYISQQELLVNHDSSWVVTDFNVGAHPGQYIITVKLLKDGGEKK